MKVLILEDVIEHQVRLERMLDEISKELNIPISYKTTGKEREFKEYIENDEVNQLYFLDIDIHGIEKKGFEVAQFIRHYNPYAIIVFITSRSEFATLTYKYQVSALDFVDKDINESLDKGKSIPSTVGDYVERNSSIVFDDEIGAYTYGYKSGKYVQFRLRCSKKDRPKFRYIPVSQLDIELVRVIKIYNRNIVEVIEKIPKEEAENIDLNFDDMGNKRSEVGNRENKGSQRDKRNTSVVRINLRDNVGAIVIAELYDEVYNATRKGIRQTYYTGYSPVRECYNLQTSDQAIGDIHYRRTLYWNPNVKTNKDGKAKIRLYNNGTCRKMSVNAERVWDLF